jgi:hypothetical protein
MPEKLASAPRFLLPFMCIAILMGADGLHARDAKPLNSPRLSAAPSALYVDPVFGDDGRAGTSPSTALRTLRETWMRTTALVASASVTINLMPGTYPCEPDEASGDCENYFSDLPGAEGRTVALRALNGAGTVLIRGGMDMARVSHFSMADLTLAAGGAYPTNASGNNVLHLAEADHVLLQGLTLAGPSGITDMDNTIQEVLKVNQADHFDLEGSDLSGTFQTVLDYFSVHYGSIRNNRIHRSGGRCAYLKGGSAYFKIEGNAFFDCREAGIQAGEGSNFPVMRTPFLHYEAYDMKIVNNVFHDIYGAGLSAAGGYDILMAYNTLYRIGLADEQGRSWGLAQFIFGSRGCTPTDEVPNPGPVCASLAAQGGWGPDRAAEGMEIIPNRNVFVFNNVFYNPAPARTDYQHLTVFAPVNVPAPFENILSPSAADDDLRLRGNVLWNGPADLPLGVEDPSSGCRPSNPTCNASQLRADNAINTVEPTLVNPEGGDFHPSPGSSILSLHSVAIPDFSGDDRPDPPSTPAGDYSNAVPLDRDGRPRSAAGPPGAYAASAASTHQRPVAPPD